MDVIDLFIGNEGTLGVIVEVEVKLLLKPEGILAGIVFFDDEDQLLAFVSKVRDTSLCTRAKLARTGKTIDESFAEKSRPDDQGSVLIDVDARALEYFDRESLSFLRERYPLVPASAVGAIFFEQEVTAKNEGNFLQAWYAYLQEHKALLDDSWFATNEQNQANLRDFRHQLPVLMNEWFARYKQRKVSTDMAVPAAQVSRMLRFSESTLRTG